MKKVSILVPIYNTAPYLSKCINSIINQTYENIEIVLINDGSTDNSLEICKQFQKIDKRIKIIDKQNSGQADSRFSGFLESSGDYIYCVDSDDYIERAAVEILVKGLEDNNCDIFYARFRLVDDNGKILSSTKKYKTSNLNNRFGIIADSLCADNIKASLCIKICKRKLWEKCYIPDVRNIRFNEDYFLTTLFAIESNCVGFTNDIIYNALQRTGSTCRSVKSDVLLTHDIYFPILLRKIEQVFHSNELLKFWYWGYAKNMYISLYIVASRTNNYQHYHAIYKLINTHSIYYSSKFISCIRSKSLLYKWFDILVRLPRLFYIVSKTISLKSRY